MHGIRQHNQTTETYEKKEVLLKMGVCTSIDYLRGERVIIPNRHRRHTLKGDFGVRGDIVTTDETTKED